MKILSLLVVLLLANAGGPALRANDAIPLRTGARSCDAPVVLGLTPGIVVNRRLVERQTHQHEVFLCSGEYLGAMVEQLGIDVYVLAKGPDGEGLARFDSPNHDRGPEEVSVVAEHTGIHLLEIGSVYRGRRRGDYQLRIRALRAATRAERHSSLALKAKLEASPWMVPGAPEEDLRRALPKLEQSLNHQQAAGNLAGQAQALAELSGVHSTLRNLLEGLTYRRASLDLWRQVGDNRQVVLLQIGIANLYRQLGEYQRAFDIHRWALFTSQKTRETLSEADSLIGLGQLQAFLGEPDEALSTLEQGLSLSRIRGHPERQMRALYRIGEIHARAGRHRDALVAFREALSQSRIETYLRHDYYVRRLTALSLIALGRLDEAEATAREALDNARQAGNAYHEGWSLTTLAIVAEVKDDIEVARSLYRQALASRDSRPSTRSDVLVNLASLELEDGRLNEALAAIRQAVQQVHLLTATVGDRELAAGYLSGRRRFHQLHLEILMRLHERQPGAGWDRQALEAHEQARARSLIEALSETRAELRRAADPDLVAEEHDLLKRLSGWRDADDSEKPMVETEISEWLARLDEVQALIRSSNRGARALARPQPLELTELQKEILDPNTVLLEYSLGEPRSFLFAVTPNSLSVFSLPAREAIETDVRRFHRLLKARGERLEFETREDYDQRIREADSEAQGLAARLSETLLAPAAGVLGARRLLIVGDGALHYLPWGALPVPEPGWRGVGTPPPLIVEHEVIDAPSASVVAALRERRRERQPTKTLAVVADPVYETPEANLWQRLSGWFDSRSVEAPGEQEILWSGAVVRSFRNLGFEAFPSLPGSRREAETILAMVPETQRLEALGYLADRDLILEGTLRDYRIVHFAAHGLLNSKHPDLSGIVLSLVDKDGAPRNGFLRLYDIYRLELSAELVVLSACQTALGKEVRGEGLEGLVRGFFNAGAPLVVASLWNSEDQATAELMTRFYRAMLRDGLPPVAALRDAQIGMWRQEHWRAPYYWAGFVPRGDWHNGR